MSSEKPLLIVFICVVIALGGCSAMNKASVSSDTQKKDDNTSNYEYDGWLFNSMRDKRKGTPLTTPPDPTSSTRPSSGVQQVSGTASINEPAGPLVAGPSSHTGRSYDEDSAGPPPSIPAELPLTPAGAVSIRDAKAEEESKGFELSDLAPENVYKGMKNAAGYGPNEGIANQAMQEGKALFAEKKYKEAAAKFATAADRWPDTPLEEDALFLQAESEFFSDQYPKAHDTYGGLLKKYTNTRHLDTVMKRQFSLGRYWEQLYEKDPHWPVTPNLQDKSRPIFDTFGYAVQAYERIRMNDPTGPLADASLMALGNAYFRHGQFENAGMNYDLLIKEYPNSKYQMKAHLLNLQAKMRMYQGSMYGVTPLNDAKKSADQTLTQFNEKQLGEQRGRVLQARAQIVEEKANRDFDMARYYETQECYGAARMYYKSVVDEYPMTDKAKEASARLQAIQDRPDEPYDYFKWLRDPNGPKTK